MSKDELDFEFTVKDLDEMILKAAQGEAGNKATRPNVLEALKAKAGLNKVRNGTKS